MLRSFAIAAVLLFHPGAGTAAEGDWVSFEGGRLRLVTQAMPDGGMRAGFQIDLEPGWKTYWRAPGGSGLPPQMNFGGSRNVASVKVAFPVPEASRDSSGLTAVYEQDVTFPIDVERVFANRPTELVAGGAIGVCRDICVPVPYRASVVHDADAGGTSFAVASALTAADAGRPSAPGAGHRITSVRLSGSQIEVEAEVPDGASKVVLFPDGPANWYLSPVEPRSLDGTAARFTLSLPAKRVADAKGTTLRFLLKADGRAVEQAATVE